MLRGEGLREGSLRGSGLMGDSRCFRGDRRGLEGEERGLDGEEDRRLLEGGGGHEIEGGSERSRCRDMGVDIEEGWGGGGGGPPDLPRFCCMRQWILNQLDRRPYLQWRY